MEKERLLKVLEASVYGFAVGDAMGMPYETGKRGEIDIYSDEASRQFNLPVYKKGMPAYWYDENLPAGVWTDDTAMTVATMFSIGELKRIDLDDMMKRFVGWNDNGAYSATGVALGQGRLTLAALDKFKSGCRAEECGGTDERDNGDGSLMRMLPFAFCKELTERSNVTIGQISSLTHAHNLSVRSCEIFVDFARALIFSDADAVKTLQGLEPPFDRLGHITDLTADEIKSSGYVVDALESTVWCLLTSDNYVDCIFKAIDLGGDTDTIAAMAGGLAGIKFGIDGIRREWIEQLQNRELIAEAIDVFYRSL